QEYRISDYIQPFTDAYTGKLVGYHMPYMRWWDTGVSAGNPRHGGSFVNTLGGFDTIIGVGREELTTIDYNNALKQAKQFNAQSTMPGSSSESSPESPSGAGFNSSTPESPSGAGFNSSTPESPPITPPHPSQMGRVGGWAELKAHEMWTIHRSADFCIGRYETLFKPGSAEALVLAKAGSSYTRRTGTSSPWSLGWRGYVTDSHGQGFPSALSQPQTGAIVPGGLDNALPDDIITYTINGLPQIAYVADIGGYAAPGTDIPLEENSRSINAVFDASQNRYELPANNPYQLAAGTPLHPTRVLVFTWDQNKFPTSTGASIGWAMGPERTIYKNYVPDTYREKACNLTLRALTDADPGVTQCRDQVASDTLTPDLCMQLQCMPSCEDPGYSACMLPPVNGVNQWDIAGIYRPKLDVQQCQGTPTKGGQPTIYNLTDTYAWTGDRYLPNGNIDPTSKPGLTVITQSASGNVDSNLWAYCVNSGYDPPPHWSRGYSGAQTGAITPSYFCGPSWDGCSAAESPQYKFFP
ncbi:MAG: hypothetical protein KGJ21_01220, partial [Pseudomonadota bacterium]|nr:hypothetical protein [Pseudomonadota bacterium]